MTQDQCLSLPSHFTHLGTCYPGSNATLQLSNPNDPQPVDFHTTGVPEPQVLSLLLLGLIAVYGGRRRPLRGSRCSDGAAS